MCCPQQKLIAKLFVSGDKCYLSCCRKRAEESWSGSWSKRKRLSIFWWQHQDSSHVAKNICIFLNGFFLSPSG